MRYFISSRHGRIKSIPIHKYNFSSEVNRQADIKSGFRNWLKRNPEILLHELNDDCFFTYTPMSETNNWQYDFIQSEAISPPFENTPLISSILGQIIRDFYKSLYKQYLNHNTFVIDKIELAPFKLLKCFQFNIEVFKDGEFYIHFLPVSKIVSAKIVTRDFLTILQKGNENASNSDEMEFSIVEYKKIIRRKFDLFDSEFLEKSNKFIAKHKNVIGTFNYYFVSNYSPSIFGELTKNTLKELVPSIDFLEPISGSLELPEFIELHNRPFYEISIDDLANSKNLVVGNNKRVNLQSAAFYNGIYQPVNDKIIQLVTVGDVKTELFVELIEKFNQGGSVEILDAIKLSPSRPIDISVFEKLKNSHRRKLLFAVLTRHQQPKDFFLSLYELNVRFTIYYGEINEHQLSNYSVKCLEKLGGTLSVLHNIYEPKTTYFIGIDLGHTTQDERSHSNLCLVFFDNKGRILTHKVIQEIPRNEALDSNALTQAMLALKNEIKKRGLPKPKKIIIHRDGKIHKQDILSFESAIKNQMNIDNYDIVEVIKSGYPIIAAHDGTAYQNLKTGNSWKLTDKNYAIIVTNVQANEQGLVLKPIIVKHHHGKTDFKQLVEQVYWFTKVYTNNLYNSTRLPATTEKANNLVSTSFKRFVSTYKA